MVHLGWNLTTCGSFCLTLSSLVSVCLPSLLSCSILALAPSFYTQNSLFKPQADVVHSPHFKEKYVLVLFSLQILIKRVTFTQHMKAPAQLMISAFTLECKCQCITFYSEKAHAFSLHLQYHPCPHPHTNISPLLINSAAFDFEERVLIFKRS